MEVRILKKQGKSIREISRITGLCQNTVRRFLRSTAERLSRQESSSFRAERMSSRGWEC